jgi:hypothetical protein
MLSSRLLPMPMNSKRLTIFAACIASLAALLCWRLLSLQAEDSPRRSTKAPSEARLAGTLSPEPWPEFHTQEFNARIRYRALAWLDSNGRDAANLIADGALAALRATVGITYQGNHHRHNRGANLAKLVEACGLSRREAVLYQLDFYREEPLIRLTAPSIQRLLLQEIDAASAANRMAVAGEMHRLAQETIRRLTDPGPHTINHDFAAVTLELAIFDHLPNDASLPDSPATAGMRKGLFKGLEKELAVRQATARHVYAALPDLPDQVAWDYGNDFLMHGETSAVFRLSSRYADILAAVGDRPAEIPNETLIEYSRRFLKEGEAKANVWLLEQSDPAPK